jgi:hypothetical protein
LVLTAGFLALASGQDGRKKSNRAQAVDWTRENNAFGANHKLVKDVQAFVDSLPSAAHGFQLELSGNLVKSGKTTILAGWRRGFWTFELSAEETAKRETSAMKKTTIKPLPDMGEVRPDFALSPPVFEARAGVPADKHITGRLPFKNLDRESLGYPSIRLTACAGSNVTICYSHYLSKFVGKDDKEFKFDFDSPKELGVGLGPTVLLIDVVEFPDESRTGRPFVVSDPVAVLVRVLEGAGKAGNEEFKILTAEELTKAFLDNEDAARKKYGGLAPVSVQGTVKEVLVTKEGHAMVYLKGSTDRLGVLCHFEVKDSKEPAKLKVGQSIIVAGAGYGIQARDVMLGFCKLIPGAPPAEVPMNEPHAVKPPALKLVRGSPAKGVIETAGTWKVVELEENLMWLADREYAIRKFPKELHGGHVVVREAGQHGQWLQSGKVILEKNATVYLALMTQYLGKEKVTAAQLDLLEKDGWKLLSDGFETTYPGDENWRWRVLRRTVERGPVNLELPKGFGFYNTGAIFIFK